MHECGTPSFEDLTDMDYWSDHMNASLVDYVHARLNPEMLLGFMQLLWPEVIEVHGRIFWAHGYSDQSLERWKKTETFRQGGMPAVQAVMNHVHVEDLFYTVSGGMSPDNLCFVASVLGAAWKGRLETEFPDRHFSMGISGTEIWMSEP
jgi:hypothetical protein